MSISKSAVLGCDQPKVSALVQGGGYLVAATGPAVLGAVHEATGAWTAPLLVVLTAVGVLAVAGTISARTPPLRPTSA